MCLRNVSLTDKMHSEWIAALAGSPLLLMHLLLSSIRMLLLEQDTSVHIQLNSAKPPVGNPPSMWSEIMCSCTLKRNEQQNASFA